MVSLKHLRMLAGATMLVAFSAANAQTGEVGSGTAPGPSSTVTPIVASFTADPANDVGSINLNFTYDTNDLTATGCTAATVTGVNTDCDFSTPGTVIVGATVFGGTVPTIPDLATIEFTTTATFTTGTSAFTEAGSAECVGTDGLTPVATCTLTFGDVEIVPVAPDISASPDPVTFSASVGQTTPIAQTVTITNSGDADGLTNIVLGTPTDAAFTVTDVNCAAASLNQGDTCDITVNLVDTSAATTVNATVEITSNASSGPLSLPLEATISAVPTPGATLDTAVLDFGTVDQGSAAPQATVTVTSSGTANLVIGTVTGFDATFTSVADTCSGQTLAPAATCTVTVAMATGTVGNLSGALSIPSNADTSPEAVTLQGVVQAAALTANPVSGTTLTGMVMPGDTATVVLTNTTADPIAIMSMVSDATNFSVADNCTGSVPANGTCTVTVTYNGPDTVMDAELTITADTGAFVFPLTGGQMEPIGIPTLSQWSMMIMASLLALMAAFGLRRQES